MVLDLKLYLPVEEGEAKAEEEEEEELEDILSLKDESELTSESESAIFNSNILSKGCEYHTRHKEIEYRSVYLLD